MKKYGLITSVVVFLMILFSSSVTFANQQCRRYLCEWVRIDSNLFDNTIIDSYSIEPSPWKLIFEDENNTTRLVKIDCVYTEIKSTKHSPSLSGEWIRLGIVDSETETVKRTWSGYIPPNHRGIFESRQEGEMLRISYEAYDRYYCSKHDIIHRDVWIPETEVNREDIWTATRWSEEPL